MCFCLVFGGDYVLLVGPSLHYLGYKIPSVWLIKLTSFQACWKGIFPPMRLADFPLVEVQQLLICIMNLQPACIFISGPLLNRFNDGRTYTGRGTILPNHKTNLVQSYEFYCTWSWVPTIKANVSNRHSICMIWTKVTIVGLLTCTHTYDIDVLQEYRLFLNHTILVHVFVLAINNNK